ncbi:MAG: cytochrome P450 [Novosphingobium sp.]|jgi:cytochrome P450|uniref:Cytochrome P450 monooxygenase n=1 Tax=Sphingobium yanoikuyae TaxID=13690 RepID=A0A1C9CIT0_SPHYA|nr:cytochrome P450 [Sphingobium yanoikuyae]AOM73592.1 cytochrome P450 monooxygenase [Sphingobium yanoikuyae]
MAEQAVLASPPSDVPADRIVDFDIYNPFKGQNDLHVAWMALRESTPHAVVWTPHNGGHWIALDPELIANVFGDSDRFSSFNVLVPKETAGEAYHFIPLSLDPPEHRPYRKILNDNLYSSSVNPLEPKVRALTASLIDNFVANGRCDFVTEFAEQLPLRVFMQLVDLPTEHLPVLKQLADQFTRPDGSMTPAEATTRFMEYVGPILNERRGSDRSDLLTAITRGEVFGRPLTDDEALRMAIQVMVGGLDTVVNFMSFTIQLLAQAPDIQDRLASDRSIYSAAINEALRRLPLVSSGRELRVDTEVDGVILRKGDMIIAPTELVALNPRMNEDPLRYDLNRKVRNHSVFGSGAHTCPGQFLARLEMKIFLEEWFDRIPSFELEPGQVLRHRGGIVGGCEPFVIRWPRQ